MSGGLNMQNERLYRLCAALGVCRDDQWLSEAAIAAIEKLQAENERLKQELAAVLKDPPLLSERILES